VQGQRPGTLRVAALGRSVTATGQDGIRAGDEVLLLARPEDITVLRRADPGDGENTLPGRIAVSTFAGASTYLEVGVADQTLKVSVHGAERFEYIESTGREVWLRLDRCAFIRRPGVAGSPSR
jgi:hypothetical protein